MGGNDYLAVLIGYINRYDIIAVMFVHIPLVGQVVLVNINDLM